MKAIIVFLMRLSRTRRNDPVMESKTTLPLIICCNSDTPEFDAVPDDIVLVAFVEDRTTSLPSYDSRKTFVATDALASVDGSSVMVQLTFQHLFGMICLLELLRL